MIRAGRLSVAGEIVDDPLAELVLDALVLVVDGSGWRYREKAYLMLHKPANFECSHAPQHHRSVFELLPPPLLRRNVQCVGRLDQDTTGLLLLSDDGQFIHHWSSGKKQIPKTYEIMLRHPLTEAMLSALEHGVQLHDQPAPIAAARCVKRGESELQMTVTEGKYHQVKRMVAAAGNRVQALHRSAVGGLTLPRDLAPGQWRWLTPDDLAQLSAFDGG